MPTRPITPSVVMDLAGSRNRGGWSVLVAAMAFSIPFHLAVALWLSGMLIEQPQRPQQAVLMEGWVTESAGDIAEQPEQESASHAPIPMDQAVATVASTAWQEQGPVSQTDGTGGDAGDLASEFGAMLGPEGSSTGGVGHGGSGLTATTTFFGTRGSGRRFAFVVDKSGSMNTDGRLAAAIDELMRSVKALPDFAQFRVCFFDTSAQIFPERGFCKARKLDLSQLVAWLSSIHPSGGTTPRVAFQQIMADPSLPDAIFFMTDGQIPQEAPAWIVKRVAGRDGIVPIHCIAFGDRSASEQLEWISRQTGGQFRFIPFERGR